MNIKKVEYGTTVKVMVRQATPEMIMAHGEDNQAYVLLKHGLKDLPAEGDAGTVVFTENAGPGYWKFVPESCTCLDDAEKRLQDHIQKDKADKFKNFKLVSGELSPRSMFPSTNLYVNYNYQYTFEKKDGSTSSEKNGTVALFFTYCPFCGRKL